MHAARSRPAHADRRPSVACSTAPRARAQQAGGESLLVSALSVWNAVLDTGRPELAAALLQPVAVDRRGEIPAGMGPFFLVPPLAWHGGLLTTGTGYQRQYAKERGTINI